jgi:hypothetical protein
MYTEICAKDGTVIAVANNSPHIHFNFMVISYGTPDVKCKKREGQIVYRLFGLGNRIFLAGRLYPGHNSYSYQNRSGRDYPVRWHVYQHRCIDQAGNYYYETDNVNFE